MSAERKVNNKKNRAAVVLAASAPINDYILYRVTVSGAQPSFDLVDTTKQLSLLKAPPPTQQIYERRWPIRGTDTFKKGETRTHVLSMTFRKAVTYRFVVEQYDDQDRLVKVLKDVEWSSQNPTDAAHEPFTVSIPS